MAARRFLSYSQLGPEKNINYSKAQLRRLANLPIDDPRRFPSPVKGLGKENVWDEAELDAYVERQVAASETAQQAA